MALTYEMRILVGGLELAASRRAGDERERRETAALDALGRAAGTANLRVEVSEKLSGLHQELVGDLELAASRRAGDERERRETAAQDAVGRAAGTANLRVEVSEKLSGLHQERATVARDARGRGAGVGLRGALDGDRRERNERDADERAASTAALRGEVAGILGGFQQNRAAQAAWDAIGRVEDERDRQVAAEQDARERAAEISELKRTWSDHVGTLKRSLALSHGVKVPARGQGPLAVCPFFAWRYELISVVRLVIRSRVRGLPCR